jgi:hypothetical protein
VVISSKLIVVDRLVDQGEGMVRFESHPFEKIADYPEPGVASDETN